MTVPANYLDEAQIKPVGLVLGHGAEADDWKGPLLTSIAVHFAKQGAAWAVWQQGRRANGVPTPSAERCLWHAG